VRRSVEVCAARHGGNLVAELAVRVLVNADGVGVRKTAHRDRPDRSIVIT
jgi:hypothetical protein